MATGWVVLIAVIALLVGAAGAFPCTQIYARLFQKILPLMRICYA